MSQRAAVTMPSPKPVGIATHLQGMLELLREDRAREGLQKTPERWEKAMACLASGYQTCLGIPMHGDLVTGNSDVAYRPAERAIGLSKPPQIVKMFSRRLQAQERVTREAAQAVADALDPKGVAAMCAASRDEFPALLNRR